MNLYNLPIKLAYNQSRVDLLTANAFNRLDQYVSSRSTGNKAYCYAELAFQATLDIVLINRITGLTHLSVCPVPGPNSKTKKSIENQNWCECFPGLVCQVSA